MDDPKLPTLEEQTLRLFRRRAEDVFACDLARRDDALRLGQELQFNLLVDRKSGETRVADLRQTIPPKEQVAYALTLLRPFTLKNDRLAWRKVISALDAQTSETPSLKPKIDSLRAMWEKYPQRRMRIMQGSIDPDSKEPTVDAWDDEIARRYLYGDLVHGDDNAELLDALGNDQVIFAASAMVSDGFILVNNTYQVLHWLRSDIAPEGAFFTVHSTGGAPTAPTKE